MDALHIRKVLDGDINAFEYFVCNYKDFALSISFSIVKDQYLAEDIVQESMIIAFQKLHTFKYKSSFKTWFGRIVINKSLKKAVKNIKQQPICDIEETEIGIVEDTLNHILESERKQYITTVFQQLQPNESLILELFYINELSLKEISSMTSWSYSKIKMLNMRGRKNFYTKLSNILKIETTELL